MYLFLFSLFAVSFKNGQSGFDNNSYFGKDTVSAIGKYSSNAFLESRQKFLQEKCILLLEVVSDQRQISPCSITSL